VFHSAIVRHSPHLQKSWLSDSEASRKFLRHANWINVLSFYNLKIKIIETPQSRQQSPVSPALEMGAIIRRSWLICIRSLAMMSPGSSTMSCDPVASYNNKRLDFWNELKNWNVLVIQIKQAYCRSVKISTQVPSTTGDHKSFTSYIVIVSRTLERSSK
jgi:hypothetical protein